MKDLKLLLVTVLLAVVPSITAASAQVSGTNIDAFTHGLGAETIRQIGTDIYFPATGEEYAALGKHAILMLKTSSAISTELTLRSVYIIYKGVRI